MIQALHTAASGIGLGMRQLDATAHNVANSRTPDFERQQVVGVERPGGGVEPRTIPGADDSLAADLVQAILAKHTVSANAAMFRRAGQTGGELVDLVA